MEPAATEFVKVDKCSYMCIPASVPHTPTLLHWHVNSPACPCMSHTLKHSTPLSHMLWLARIHVKHTETTHCTPSTPGAKTATACCNEKAHKQIPPPASTQFTVCQRLRPALRPRMPIQTHLPTRHRQSYHPRAQAHLDLGDDALSVKNKHVRGNRKET